MTTSIDLLVHGASGRMGQRLLALSAEFARLHLVAAVARGTAGLVVPEGVAIPAMRLSEAPAFRLLIDFSLPEAFDAALALAVQRRAAFVSGTTGLSLAQLKALEAASRQIPVLWSANFSLGVAVLDELVERAAAALKAWDCDIVEAHHTRKLDAPSGTALALGAAAERGGADPRYASLRAGDIVGEHLVQFAGPGERIELIHRATSRDIFARGALHAAAALPGRAAGSYRLRDLLGNA
jgi:4-hydroxy-tetrahydrodipicolinate reductase